MAFPGSRGNEWIARILACVCAGFWMWFGLASGLAEGLSPAGVLIHLSVPGLFFALLVFAASRWEAAGGVALTVAGAVIAVLYPRLFPHFRLPVYVLTILTMALPPFLAGILFLLHWRARRQPRQAVGQEAI